MPRLNERYRFDWKRIQFEDNYHIEYSVTDICNRNCKGCSHLAPLAKDPNFVTVEEFTRVTKIMHNCIPDAHTVWITGGEPTLHPEFMTLLSVLRDAFPDSYVGIYSNGSTLPKRENDEGFWRFIRKNGIVWAITTYETPQSYFENLFEKHGCLNNLTIVQSGTRFFNLTTYSVGQPVSEDKYNRCGWERIKINIRNGRIYSCPASEFADLFNAYFGAELKLDEKDYLVIDETLTRERIDKFKGPIPFCSQCDLTARHTKIFRNVPSERLIEEWSSLNFTEEVKK